MISCGLSLPGSSIHGILQARKLEWVAISSSRGSSWPRDWTHISCISCIGRWILYRWATWESLSLMFLVVQLLSHVWLFETPWIAAHKASLSLPISWSLLKFMSIASVHVHSAISFSDTLFSCSQSFPVSGTSPISWLFTSDDQNTGASALAWVLPTNIQGWFPLRLTGLISLVSKELSGVFSSTTVWRYQFFGILPSLQSSPHNCMWPLGSPWTLTIWTFVGRVMSLLLNTLSRFCLSVSSVQSLSRVQLFVTSWTTAHQASLSITNS